MAYLLGDLGGTHLALCVCDDGGALLCEPVCHPAHAHLPADRLIALWADDCRELAARHPFDAFLLGIPTKERDGRLIPCENLPTLGGQPLGALLAERLGISVFTFGDALCYAMGAHREIAPGAKSSLTVALGTGVGLAWIIDGKSYQGNGLTGEMWKAPYLDGMLEDVLSLRGLLRGTHAQSGKELAMQAQKGCEKARIAFASYGRALGTLLCYAVGTMDPECVLLGGGLAQAYPFFETETRAMLRDYSLRGEIPIHICPNRKGLTPLLGVYWLYRELTEREGQRFKMEGTK